MNTRLFAGLALLIMCSLFVGVYADPEFHNWTIFVKHKPTIKPSFFSPIGESDMTLKDLSSELVKEELAFEQFVKKQRAGFAFRYLAVVVYFVVPLAILLITTGAGNQGQTMSPRRWVAYYAFTICLFFCSIAICYLFSNKWASFGIFSCMIALNIIIHRSQVLKGTN